MDRFDVAIMGGGLAGLTLGVQLKGARPETSILVLEKRKGPAPDAAFKVGESTVELAAHYFADVVGMKEHLRAAQLPKAGLRYFFPAGDNSDIAQRVEWGSGGLGPVPSFQIDRGRFENALAERNRELGNEVRDGVRVEDVELDPAGGHAVLVDAGGERGRVGARWVVDASAYPGILKRKLGLAQGVEHTINAAWFRLGRTIDYEEWSDDPDWLGRMDERGVRRLSTSHLMGTGYWVWLIPLSSGSISIGIVADPRFHPFEEMASFEDALGWLHLHEPQLAQAVEERRASLQDFLRAEDFAYGCERVFSPDRWAITGIAGVFIDPFYSPGSDFIARANTMITDLVRRDLDGEEVAQLAGAYDRRFLDAFERTITGGYTDHYAGFGNARVMVAKVMWDFAWFWASAALPFMHGKYLDAEFAGAVEGEARRVRAVRAAMSRLFRDWHAVSPDREWRNRFITPRTFPSLAQLYLDLHGDFDDEGLRRKYAENTRLLEAIAVVVFHAALEDVPDATVDAGARMDAAAIGLDGGRWDADGLFTEDGLSLTEARALAQGIETMFLDRATGRPVAQASEA